MNACELTASITALANWLACQLSLEELELLGVSLTQLGDTILTIVTQKAFAANEYRSGQSTRYPKSGTTGW